MFRNVYRALRAVDPTGRKAKTPPESARGRISLGLRRISLGLSQNRKDFFKNLTAEAQRIIRKRVLTADLRRLSQTREQQCAERKALGVLNRRLTQIFADYRGLKFTHRRGAKVAENCLFCLSGEGDKQKHISIADDNRIKISI